MSCPFSWARSSGGAYASRIMPAKFQKTASSRDPDSNKRAAASTSRSGLARSASASKLYRGTGHGRIRGQQTLLDRWVLPPGGWSPAEAQQDEDAATNESDI